MTYATRSFLNRLARIVLIRTVNVGFKPTTVFRGDAEQTTGGYFSTAER